LKRRNEQRANIVAEIGSGSPILALSGHMDVVDAGNQDNWTYPPFQLTEKDGNSATILARCSLTFKILELISYLSNKFFK
jgi:acetylornithine deacetylase/succinyl-diaminopimelate desuccinylase-like protein